MFFKKVLLAVPLPLLSVFAWSQGCSDAGFCTIGALRPGFQKDTTTHHRVSAGMASGQGDAGVLVLTPFLLHDWLLNNNWMLQTKITGNYASGNLGNATGAGDVFVTATYRRPINKKWQVLYTAGLKLPLNSANLSTGGLPLPMQYQSSLGTIDAIAGLSITDNKWQFAAAIQIPMSGENKNGFLPVYWNNKEDALNYPATNRLLRKSDVLLRVSRQLISKKLWNLGAGLLGIYHLAEDRFIDPFIGPERINIVGSKGLTLNVTAQAGWQLSRRIHLGLMVGAPAVVREVRPDGLTRRWVAVPEISFRF
jgi:hypothetical protein